VTISCGEAVSDSVPGIRRPLVGQSVRRREDARFVAGTGTFLDDISPPGMLHGVVLRSSHAHARLRSLDLDAARAIPGVHLVLGYSDIAASGLSTVPLDIPPPGDPVAGRHCADQPILANQFVRYVGDSVAFIVADSVAQARDAAEAIVADYEQLPVIIDPTQALAGQTLAWHGKTTNLVFEHAEGDAAAVEEGFARADTTVRLELVSNRVDALPLETRACIGSFHDEFTLHVSTQRVHILQRALADRVFGVPRDRMRVIAPDTGGGFGQKNGLYPEYVLCLEAARRLGRPVKWIAERSESLQCDCHGRDNVFTIEAALQRDGRILAIRAVRLMNLGAYTAPRAMVPVLNGLTHLTGVYAIAAAHVRVQGVLTNTACTSPYRGAGRPENVYCCERLIEAIAHRLAIDPIELRRRNLLQTKAMPWTSPLGTRFENADFAGMLGRALADIDHAGFAARRKQARKAGKLRGIGVALFAEDLHGSHEPIPAHLKVQGGRLAVMVGSGSAGHGHETSLLQIASDRLALPMAALDFAQSDTALIPDGVGTAASWSITLAGSSVHCAAIVAIESARQIAARLHHADLASIQFEDGLFRVAGTNRSLGWMEIFAEEPGFMASASFAGSGQSVPIGCHACEVDVDPETGQIEVRRFAVAQDAGRVINPMLVRGQLHSGVAQGVGQAWSEAILYDSAGQLVSGSLMDYGVLRASDLPDISTTVSETIETTNPIGVKGIGESAATGSTPAFVNAVLNALAPLGVHHLETPLSPQNVWRSIRMQCQPPHEAG
jgi:carbon-monoxide dehydrogenase large subunit